MSDDFEDLRRRSQKSKQELETRLLFSRLATQRRQKFGLYFLVFLLLLIAVANVAKIILILAAHGVFG